MFPYFIIMAYLIFGYTIYSTKVADKFAYKDRLESIFKPEYFYVILLLFSGLRGNGDGDYFNYLNGVKHIQSLHDVFFIQNYPFEFGFRVISYITNVLHGSPQFSIFIMSLISLTTIKYLIKKYSSNIWLSWIMYFPFLLMFDMHHSRNSIAMAFTLLFFFKFVIENNNIHALISIFCALSFHKSAIFPILIITLYKYLYSRSLIGSWNLKKLIIFLLILLPIGFVISPLNISNILVGYFPNISLFYKLNAYLNNPRWSYPFSLLDPRLILMITIIFISINYTTKDKSKLFVHIQNYYIIGLILVFLLSDSTLLTIRFYNFFNMGIIFLVPLIFENLNNYKYNIQLKYFILITHLLYFCALIYKQVPYYLF